MPVVPALMILFQVERHDSELHRPCSAAPHDPAMLRTIPPSRRGVYRVRGTQRIRVSTIALWALWHPLGRSQGSRGEPAGPQSCGRPDQAGTEAAGPRPARYGGPIEWQPPLTSIADPGSAA